MCSKRMKGFIYKITSPSTDKMYVGSTTQSLLKRFNIHKCHVKRYNCSSNFIISLGDAVINLIEEVEFENKKELYNRERHHIQLNHDMCVNERIPTRTDREYRFDNADTIKKKISQYYIDNADILKARVNCECGGKYTHKHKSRHLKTLIHQNYITSII